MVQYDAERVACFVFTEKEGLLSRVAHDLKLRVTRLSLTLSGDEEHRAIDATFDPSALRVECAMVDGREDRDALSASDREKIEATVRDEVLHTRRHPEIRFRSTSIRRLGDLYEVRGELALHGVTRPLRLDVRRVGDGWETEVVLHQADYRIVPYRAALGALRVKPDVRVRVHAPDESNPPPAAP